LSSPDDRYPHGPFKGCRQQDRLLVTLTDGSVLRGSFLSQVGMAFVHVDDGSMIGKVEGPYSEEEIKSVEVTTTRDEIMDERRERRLGARHPGREPVTRDDFEYRLESLVRAAFREDGERRSQLLRQFEETADRIMLAKAKRNWLIRAGSWGTTSNSPPTLRDLWMSDVSSPSLIARPRPQDFDPDPVERRKRPPLPTEAVEDPLSVPNMMARLRAEGFEPEVALVGEPAWERAVVQIDLGPGRSMRFCANAARNGAGEIEWTLRWGGNDSEAARKKHRQATRLPSYVRLREIVLGKGSQARIRTGDRT
jgi:hypothetical protein